MECIGVSFVLKTKTVSMCYYTTLSFPMSSVAATRAIEAHVHVLTHIVFVLSTC